MANESVATVLPVAESQRIESLDVLRGVALLGILMVNIQSFFMPGTAYHNPAAYGDLSGFNYVTMWLTYVFFDSKMMGLFSLLFGAGIVMMWDRAQQKGASQAPLHYRRMIWLGLLGLLHAHLIWFGDILFFYAICGMLLFPLRKLSPRWLIIIGLIVLSVSSLVSLGVGTMVSMASEETVAEIGEEWFPSQEKIDQEIETYRSSFVSQLDHRMETAFFMETFVFLWWGLWRAGGLFLGGMALYKLGVLSAKRSNRFYWTGAIIGLGLGIPVSIYGLNQNIIADWSVDYSKFLGNQYLYWASLPVAFGYICLVMLAVKNNVLGLLGTCLKAVGRMALTNYLGQSVICTLLSYGHGLAWFGAVSRSEQFTIVICIWIFQLIASPIWLHYFHFGPMEWLWRTLSYWKRQPFLRTS